VQARLSLACRRPLSAEPSARKGRSKVFQQLRSPFRRSLMLLQNVSGLVNEALTLRFVAQESGKCAG